MGFSRLKYRARTFPIIRVYVSEYSFTEYFVLHNYQQSLHVNLTFRTVQCDNFMAKFTESWDLPDNFHYYYYYHHIPRKLHITRATIYNQFLHFSKCNFLFKKKKGRREESLFFFTFFFFFFFFLYLAPTSKLQLPPSTPLALLTSRVVNIIHPLCQFPPIPITSLNRQSRVEGNVVFCINFIYITSPFKLLLFPATDLSSK